MAGACQILGRGSKLHRDAILVDQITRCGPDDLDRLATVAVGGAGRASRIGGQERRRHRLPCSARVHLHPGTEKRLVGLYPRTLLGQVEAGVGETVAVRPVLGR